MNNVYFTAEGHKYTNLIEDYESVSGLWKPYIPEFKGEEISLKIAFKELDPKAYRKALDTVKYTDPKFIDTFWSKTKMGQELFYQRAIEVRGRWAAKTQRGTDLHNMKEAIDRTNGFSINPFDGKKYPIIEWDIKEGYENQSFPGDLRDLPDGYVAEHLVKHDLSKTAGQLDKNYIETIGSKRYIDIDDYKGLALGTLIPTPTGFRKIDDFVVGDKIYNSSGEVVEVVNVSQVHYNPCYKIDFDTNDSIIADHEHKWVVSINKSKTIKGKKIYYKEEVEMTTEEMYSYKGKTSIKCSGIQGTHKDLPIDPYLLGLWLADGSSHSPRITCIYQDIWDELARRGFEFGKNVNKEGAEERTVLGQSKFFKELNLYGNKHIPQIYMDSSYEQRLDLLRGYMDGDGYLHRGRKRCVMDTTSTQQANDVSSLVSSLGFKPTTIPYTAKGFGLVKQAWAITFTPTVNPFLIRNKDYETVIGDQMGKYSKVRYIKSITKVDTVPTKCLAVSGEDKTYLFSKNFIKTHNTDKKIDLVPTFYDKNKGGLEKLHYPFSHIYNSNFHKYSLKISTYAKIMEKSGFIVRNLAITHVLLGDDGEVLSEKLYKIPYKSMEAELALDLRRKNLANSLRI